MRERWQCPRRRGANGISGNSSPSSGRPTAASRPLSVMPGCCSSTVFLVAMFVPLRMALGGGSRLGGRPTSIADTALPTRQFLFLGLQTARLDPGQGGSKVVLDGARLPAVASRRALGERVAQARVTHRRPIERERERRQSLAAGREPGVALVLAQFDQVVLVDLAPGRYALVSLLPDEDGVPDLAQGMEAELRVG